MKNQPQNPEFRIDSEKFHPCNKQTTFSGQRKCEGCPSKSSTFVKTLDCVPVIL